MVVATFTKWGCPATLRIDDGKMRAFDFYHEIPLENVHIPVVVFPVVAEEAQAVCSAA